jgi:hypothetical protein
MTARLLAAAVFAAGLALTTAAADPKPARVAIDDPAKAKEDPDFAVQGEYEGEVSIGGTAGKGGIQIVAQGGGKFLAKPYRGGLPGAGWDGKKTGTGTATRDGSTVTLKDDKGEVVGELKDGTITLKGDKATGTLKRVERTSPTLGAKPPEVAVVLFAEPGDEKNWAGGKLIELSDGKFLNYGIKSKQAFGPFTAHVEFRLPYMPNSRGQGRGNSGVYLQDRYELQVLDSFGLTGENNEAGGFYTLHKPAVNMCLPPLVWQTYDIDFTPAQFDADGKKTANARATVKHNGVVVQDNVELKGPTGGGQPEKPTPGPFQFQNHGDPLVYRNVWVVEKK